MTDLTALFTTSQAIDDVVIGGTTPAAGTFTTLTATSVTANGGVTVDNINIDGTEIDLSSGDLSSGCDAGNIDLDADGGTVKVSDGGTEILNITNSSSDVIIKPVVDGKDIIFQQRDGTEVARIEDNGTFNVVTDKFAINGTAVTSAAAELNIMDGVTATANELNIMDGVTATTAELNHTDGVTSAIQTQLDTKHSAVGNGLQEDDNTTVSLKNSFLAASGICSNGTATSFTASTYPHFISGATTSSSGGTFTVTEADGSTHTLNMRDGDSGTPDTFATLYCQIQVLVFLVTISIFSRSIKIPS